MISKGRLAFASLKHKYAISVQSTPLFINIKSISTVTSKTLARSGGAGYGNVKDQMLSSSLEESVNMFQPIKQVWQGSHKNNLCFDDSLCILQVNSLTLFQFLLLRSHKLSPLLERQ
jgi:hypothetical protein